MEAQCHVMCEPMMGGQHEGVGELVRALLISCFHVQSIYKGHSILALVQIMLGSMRPSMPANPRNTTFSKEHATPHATQ